VADTNNRLYQGVYYQTSQFVIEGGIPGTCVPVGANINIKNLYGGQFYLDACGWGPCSLLNGYGVQAYMNNNRGGYGTGTWSLILPTVYTPPPVQLGTAYYIQNQYGSKSVLDVTAVAAGCYTNALLVSTFLTGQTLPNGGGWIFSEVTKSGNTCLTYGAVVNIQSTSKNVNGNVWLDTCGASTNPDGGCSGSPYSLNVQVCDTPNRIYQGQPYKTGQWTIVGSSGQSGCVHQGDQVYIQNLYTNAQQYLDVCDWGPAGQTGYWVQTYPTTHRTSTPDGVWTIHS